MRISDWSSDVCSSDLVRTRNAAPVRRLNKGKPFRPSPALDFISFRRKRRTPSLTVNHTHNACKGMIDRCGNRSGDCAARAIMAKGELHGKSIAEMSEGCPGRLTEEEGRKKIMRSEERRVGKKGVRRGRDR